MRKYVSYSVFEKQNTCGSALFYDEKGKTRSQKLIILRGYN